MEEKEILRGVANAFVEDPVYEFTVNIDWHPERPAPATPRRTFWDKLVRKPIIQPEPLPPLETVRTFQIRPCKVGNFHRVAGRATILPNELRGGQLSESTMPLMSVYREDMVYIIASAIQNNHLEPDQELITFIERNFNSINIMEGLAAAFNGLEMESFLNSIVLAKGTVTFLAPNASPQDGSESIASHKVK